MFFSLSFFFCFLFSEFGYDFFLFFFLFENVFFDDNDGDDSWMIVQYAYLGLLFIFYFRYSRTESCSIAVLLQRCCCYCWKRL